MTFLLINDIIGSMLDEIKEKFLKFLKEQGKADATILAYGKDIEQLIDFLKKAARVSLNEVTSYDLEEFVRKLKKEGFTLKTVSRKINSLKTFYRFLKNEGLVKTNIAASLTHPKYELKVPRVLNKMEYRALRDVTRSDIRTYALVELFLQTGLRISEAASLKLEDVQNNKLVIDRREIPLNSSVSETLSRYLAIRPKSKNSTIFITKTGKSLLVRNIRSAIDRVLKVAGVENAKVNDLRNTFIAHQLAAGSPLEYISKLVGHKRVSTTERYLGLTSEKPKKSAKLIEL